MDFTFDYKAFASLMSGAVESISRARGWEYTGVVTRDPAKREIPAASQPSTVRTAKSTICCNVSPTVLAEIVGTGDLGEGHGDVAVRLIVCRLTSKLALTRPPPS